MGVPRTIGMIWSQAKQGVIGADGTIPWMLPEARAIVDTVTAGHPVIMGRRTWDALAEHERALPGRVNIVVTRNDGWAEPGAAVAHSLDDALAGIDDDEVWIVGGAQLFSEAVGVANQAVITEVDHVYNGSAYAPGLGSEWRLVSVDPATGWNQSTTRMGYRTFTYSKS
jgi:dihydrofolate reductase